MYGNGQEVETKQLSTISGKNNNDRNKAHGTLNKKRQIRAKGKWRNQK
jgi:hypothetical protein